MKIPERFWEAACNSTSMPLAAVNTKNHFLWVNEAFERLVGYSLTELRKMTWMEITEDEDVGGDLASAKDIVGGHINQYIISKKYRHKFGHSIPVQLSVWRFPREVDQVQTCFIVEASPETVTFEQFDKVVKRLEGEINELRNDDPDINIRIGDNTGGDHVGRDKVSYTNTCIALLLGLITALLVTIIFLVIQLWT